MTRVHLHYFWERHQMRAFLRSSSQQSYLGFGGLCGGRLALGLGFGFGALHHRINELEVTFWPKQS